MSILENYVRVSEVLSRLQSFDHIPAGILEAKKILGINVHTAIKDLINGEFPVVVGREVPYIKSFENWWHIKTPSFLVTEERYYCHKKMLTGQIDALVKLKGKEESILIDFKTSRQESPIIWRLQAHLYYYLLKENLTVNLSKKFIFLKLDHKGGQAQAFEYHYDQTILDQALAEVDKYWEEKYLREMF